MPYVEAHVSVVLEQLSAMAATVPKMREVPTAIAREMYVGMVQMMDRPAQPLARQEDLTIAGVPCRLYQSRPKDLSSRSVFVYFHGGGFVIGNLATHHALVSEIATVLDMTVVAVDYRLAPEHPFPAAYDDCLAVTKAIAAGLPAIGHPVSGLVLGGDSAGGNLAATVSLAMKDAVKAQLLLYPVVDFVNVYQSAKDFSDGYILDVADMSWFENCYIPVGTARDDARLSPIFTDMKGAPPAVVITCGLDPLRDQGRAYADKLIAAGVKAHHSDVSGHPHGCFQFRAAMPLAQDALLDGLQQIKTLFA